MSKRVRNIFIVIFLVLVILLTSVILLKMNSFNFKRFEFKNPKQSEKVPSKEEDNNENSDDMLPSEDDVVPSEDDLLPSDDDVDLSDEPTTPNNGTNSTKTTKNTTTKKTTTKKIGNTTQNTGMPSVSTVKFDTDINSVKLNSIKTRDAELDNKVGSILSSITNSNMTNNQKLYAVFRYIIDHAEYGNPFLDGNAIANLINQKHYNQLDGRIVYEAKKILFDGVGVCDDYASLFVVMARRLGFDAYFVGGGVKKASGGTTGHAWANILANGTYYVFDPQIADKRPSQEKYYYGKTDKEITIYTYDNRESYIKSFNKFKETAPLKLDVKLSGAVNDTKSVSSYSSNIIKDVEYKAYVAETINLNIKTSGASKYTYNVRVKPTNGDTISLYSKQNDTNNNLNLSYKFEKAGRYAIYTTVWSGDTGIIAEYYFNVNVTVDDRIKDINVTYNKEVEHSTSGDYPYYTFSSNVIKNSSNSTCTPNVSYVVLSTDDPLGTRSIYNSRMYYDLGYTYNIKVIATCGSEKFEKTIIVK